MVIQTSGAWEGATVAQLFNVPPQQKDEMEARWRRACAPDRIQVAWQPMPAWFEILRGK